MRKVSLLLPCALLLLLLGSGHAHNELENLLERQQLDLSLSQTDVDALRPFYRVLQAQHDYLYSLKLQAGDGSDKAMNQVNPSKVDPSFAINFDDFRAQLQGSLDLNPGKDYDTLLPSLNQVLGLPRGNVTKQQLMELEDLRDILQDVIDESQLGINQLVQRANDLETELLKLNKPKIVIAAIGALEFMWNYWGRATQAAYCSYSHVPQFKEALEAINGGVECYSYTMGLILQIQNETVASVKEIKQHVQGLVKIYKKIAAKKTLMGKILSGTLNVFSALRRIHDIIAVGLAGYDKIHNQLPGAAHQTVNCGTAFVESIPQMVETAQNLTMCITYVETNKPDYEFLKPEDERYWNTGNAPPEIPHEDEVENNDEDKVRDDEVNEADNLEDDYVDHR